MLLLVVAVPVWRIGSSSPITSGGNGFEVGVLGLKSQRISIPFVGGKLSISPGRRSIITSATSVRG